MAGPSSEVESELCYSASKSKGKGDFIEDYERRVTAEFGSR